MCKQKLFKQGYNKMQEIIQCQYCKRFLINYKWHKLFPMFLINIFISKWNINHTPCPDCFKKEMEKIENL